MPARILGPILLLALLAWLLWPSAGEAPPPSSRSGVAATAADPAAAMPGAATAEAPETGTVRAPASPRIELPGNAAFLVQGRAVCAVDEPVPGAKVRARAFTGIDATGDPTVTGCR